MGVADLHPSMEKASSSLPCVGVCAAASDGAVCGMRK